MGIDGTPGWSFRGAVILPGGVKRMCSSVKSGVLLRNSLIRGGVRAVRYTVVRGTCGEIDVSVSGSVAFCRTLT